MSHLCYGAWPTANVSVKGVEVQGESVIALMR